MKTADKRKTSTFRISDIRMLKEALKIANQDFDGHFTLMKFTTNWRAGFFTPMDRDQIQELFAGETPARAIRNAINFYEDFGK